MKTGTPMIIIVVFYTV